VPAQLLLTAEEKLRELENNGASINLDKYADREKEEELAPGAKTEQISFFSFAPNPVVERLKALDLMNITPSQAFGLLEELKRRRSP
jgi:DNA mismatch repair protein MutS